MASYDFKCSACDHTFSLSCRIDDREKPLKEVCPSCKTEGVIQRDYSNQNFELSDVWRMGYKKPNRDWREFLGKMEKANPGSSINAQI